MTFLNPAYLWALLGLAVPVAIHLWSKKEGKVIKIGSIRLLREVDPKQTSTLNFNELWLLLLRMLIISILVLIMTEPRLKKDAENVSVTYLFEPSLLSYEEVNSITDSLNTGVAVRLLQPGLPEYRKNEYLKSKISTPNYWQLVKEMEELPTDSIIVFTNAFASGFKGRRPNVWKSINWVVLDPGEPEKKGYIGAIKKGEEAQVISVVSDHQSLQFKKEVVPLNDERITINEEKDRLLISDAGDGKWIPLITQDPLKIGIFYEGDLENEMKYVGSSFRAISKYLDQPVDLHIIQDTDSLELQEYAAMVWLSEVKVPVTKIPLLIYEPDSLANSLIEPGTAKNIFHLTGRLNPENSIAENFPEQLLALLEPYKRLDKKTEQYDRRVMESKELVPVQIGGVAENVFSETINLINYSWIMLLALLLAERGLARYRKQ